VAPELLRDARVLTAASDVWSLGCILLEMVTGAMPFAGLTANEVLMRPLEKERGKEDGRRRGKTPTFFDPENLRSKFLAFIFFFLSCLNLFFLIFVLFFLSFFLAFFYVFFFFDLCLRRRLRGAWARGRGRTAA
jgi:serine/threonine protein kinase